MNREEAAELFPIIKAFSEERPIQYRIKDNKTAIWIDVDKNYHEFSLHSFQYRIKPEEEKKQLFDFLENEDIRDMEDKDDMSGCILGLLIFIAIVVSAIAIKIGV